MRRLLIILLLITVSFSFAQVKFGKVSKDELLKSKSEMDSEAPAEIISKVGRYKVEYSQKFSDFMVSKEIRMRIKIYDKEKAPDFLMKVEIPLYKSGSAKEKIYDITATTFNLEDGKIEKTKVKRTDIFEEEMTDYMSVKKFAFPNIKNGSIIEYKYTIVTPIFFDLGTWYIQTEIPVQYNQLRVKYPDFFYYQKDRRGQIINKIASKSEAVDNNRFIIDELIYTNVPPLKEEPFVQNLNNLRVSVRYELKEYNNPGFGAKSFSSTWSEIMKDLDNSSSFGGELKGNNFLEEEVKQFSEINDLEKKIESIFEYVKSNYTWDEYYGLYPRYGIRKTFKDKSGNGTDLNFLLIALLRKSGIKANPIVLSTVKNGMLNFYPSKQKLNHTITGVIIKDQVMLMDPSGEFSKINMLPPNDLNFIGYMMLEEGKYKEIDLVNRLVSKINHTLIYEMQDDVFHGTYELTKTNYFAMQDLSKKQKDESNFKSNFAADINADITNISFKENITNDAIRYKVEFEDDKAIENLGNKILFKPLLFIAKESNAFKFSNQEREYPLEFGTPSTTTCVVQFKIPEGYEIESLPESKKMLLPNDAGGYNIEFEQIDGALIVKSLLYIAASNLPPNYYVEIKNLYQSMIELENEQVILNKK